MYKNSSNHSYWPGNLEMLITDVMMLGTDSAGRGVSLLIVASLVGILAGFTHQIFQNFSGAVPAILLFTVPTVVGRARFASTDLAGSFWMLGAIALLIVWLYNSESKFCLLGGAFMGFSLGTKYNFMYEIAAVALTIIIYGLIVRRPFLTTKNIKVILLSALVAIVVGSSWYIRNWILTGNPIYPFYYFIFGGSNWSAALDKEFMFFLKSDYVRPALWKVPSSLFKNRFYIFYLLPLGLIACRRPKQILIISLGLLNFLAWYYLGTYQLRLGITWQVLLTLAIAYGLLETNRYWRKSHYIILLILCVLLIKQLPGQYRSEKPRIKVALERQSREEYLATFPGSDGTYPLIDYANKNLPDGTVLVTFRYNAGHYYSKHEYLMLHPLVSGVIDHTAIKSPEEYAQAVINTGATHLLCGSSVGSFFVSPVRVKRYHKLHEWHKYFILHHTRVVKRNGNAFLYEIIPEESGEPVETILPKGFLPKSSIRPEYSIVPLGNPCWDNYTVECDITIPSSARISCAGVLIRYNRESDSGMRFWIRIDNTSAQLSFWHGTFRNIQDHTYPVKVDTKYRIKVIVKEHVYSCFINDKLMIEYEDKMKTFPKGAIGLITYGVKSPAFDRVFDNVIVKGGSFTTDLTDEIVK